MEKREGVEVWLERCCMWCVFEFTEGRGADRGRGLERAEEPTTEREDGADDVLLAERIGSEAAVTRKAAERRDCSVG